MTNCPNCGAPIRGLKCEYCGTPFRNEEEIFIQTNIFYADNIPVEIWQSGMVTANEFRRRIGV